MCRKEGREDVQEGRKKKQRRREEVTEVREKVKRRKEESKVKEGSEEGRERWRWGK